MNKFISTTSDEVKERQIGIENLGQRQIEIECMIKTVKLPMQKEIQVDLLSDSDEEVEGQRCGGTRNEVPNSLK